MTMTRRLGGNEGLKVKFGTEDPIISTLGPIERDYLLV